MNSSEKKENVKSFISWLAVLSMWAAIFLAFIAMVFLHYLVPNASNVVIATTLASAVIISPIIVLLLGRIFRQKPTA